VEGEAVAVEEWVMGRERREAMARPHWSQVLVLILVVPSSKKVTDGEWLLRRLRLLLEVHFV